MAHTGGGNTDTNQSPATINLPDPSHGVEDPPAPTAKTETIEHIPAKKKPENKSENK